MGSNCCKGDAAGRPIRSRSSIYSRSRAGASLDDRFAASEDAGGVRLTVSAARVGDSGVYTLQASNAAGSDTTRVRLEVSPDEAPTGDDPPTFLRRLQDLTVKVGTRTRFLVEIISSTECKVTWYRNERRLMEAERVALARDGNLWCADLASVSVDDAGRWTCTAENDGGRASCSAYLNVLVPKAYKRPEFVEELRALLTEQGTVSLECKVVGVPTPVLRWFKDSREIKAGDVFALTANAEDPTSLGTYTCEAVNCMGRAYSSSKVHVVGRGSREGSARPSSSGVTPEPPPIFTKELEDQFVRISEHLSLSCHIMVPPWPRAVVWYNKEGKVEPNERYHVVEDGVGGYLLEVLAAEWCDEGEWKCVATSQGGRVGISTCYVAMDVPKNYRKPRFMENLQAVLTEEGLVSFECKVVGFPTPVLSWFKDGQELKPGDVYQLTGTNSLGSYCCIARNCMGQASSSAELTVEDIQNQLNEEEKLQLFSKNQAPKFIQGLKSVEAKIDEPFRFTIKVAIPPEPSLLWYRDEQPVDESTRCHLGNEEKGEYFLDIQNLEFIDQAEWKCVAKNDFGHSVTSCFLKLIIPRHYKKPRFLENLQAILSDEGAVNLECKVIGVPQPILKWYKDGEELKPGDIHRIISGQDGTCCLGTYTCEAQNCMGIAASSASLLGFDDSMKAKSKKKAEEQALQRNLSLSTIHEERTSQMYDTPVGDITLDDKGEISFSFDGKEVSVSLYETPDLTEEEALQIVEMYADQLSENVTEHNVIELPPLRFVKETSTSGNLLMEAIIIDVSPEYFASPEEDLRTEADIEDISIADENAVPQLSLDQDVGGEDYLEKTMALLSEEKSDVPKKIPRKKSDSPRSGDDYFSLSRDHSLSEDKKDDDTQMLTESDLQSFASARSSGKPKSKSSKPSAEDGQESSDVTKTILFKDEAKKHAAEPIEPPVVKPKRERRSSRGSRRSSSGSEKSVNKPKEDLPLIQTEVVQPSIMPLMSDKEFKAKMSNVSISLSKIINDVQIIEKDIILKSELMSSAATASRSLEIISSLITPLSEIHSIADAAAESGNESKEVSSSLFNKLPQSLKTLQQSLTIIEKCIDVESDSKTLVKKTCVAFIEKCGGEINQLLSDIGLVTKQNYLLTEKKTLANIESLVNDMTNVIKFSADTIKAKNLISEASEIKVDEPSIESKHIKDTQKAVFELKSPLNSLLCIAESAETDQLVDITKVKSSEVILVNMSASIQDLQTALEQIESLSVKEASTSLNKYNTEIIEIVMQPILKLRNSFEQLSTESKNDEDKNVLKQALNAIKQNLNELSSQIKLIETNVGTYDVLQSDNKLEILQKMAQILIALENNLPRLELIPEIKLHMATFHKNLTKVLENVIESNDAKRYFTLLEICGAVNRVNNAIKNIDSDSVLSLASLCSTLRIIQDQFVNNIFESELNCSILTNITDVLLGIQEAINHADEISVQQESEHIQELSAVLYDANKAKVIVEHLDHVIAAISTVKSIESAKDLQLALTPAFESICPVLEDLKRNVASIRPTEIHEEEHISELSDVSIAQSIATPLCELNQNIMILNETIVENIASLKENSEIMATIAAPLYELHSTLQILQQDVISQYDENLTPYDVSINMVSAVQNLQSCIVMIQEHAGIDAIDEMSTLEDISCIKTTADPIPSDRLVLPSGEETAVHQSLLPLRQELTTTATAEALQTLNEHITVLQNPEIIDALDTLSEVSDYSSLKSFALGLDELHAGIDQILHPILIEHSNEILNFSDTSKLAAVAEPMQELQQCLSVLSTSNIPIYEHILELPTEKIHSVFKNISDFKEHLTKCMLAIFPAMETADKTIEISNKVEALRDVCEHLRDIITTTKLVSTALPVNQEVSDLEHLINNLLDATDVTKGIKIDQVKGITEDLFNKVLTVQEELIQFTPHTPENLAQEAKLIQAINEIESNIAVLEQYDFVDLSRASDITSCTSPQLALELEAESLLQIDDMVENAVNIIQDSTEETSLRDLLVLENFFKICKDKFTILRCLITKQLSHKKIIRLVQEFKSLQSVIDEFKTKKSDLRLSIEINDHLFGFLSHADESLEGIHNSLIKILSSQSELLFKIPAAKLETANEVLKQTLSNQKAGNNEELIEKFIHVIELIKPIIQKAETDIIGEIQTRSVHSLTDENIVTKRLQELFLLVENQASVQSLDNETREVLNNILNCAQKHKEYEVATGTGKTLIIIKCLSECVDILQASFSESNLPETEMTKTKQEDSTLKIIVSEMMEPLQALHTHIVNVQEQILSGADEESISFDITSTESLVQTVSDIHKEIVKQIEDIEMSTVDSKDRSIIIEVDKELLMIQESMKSIENVQGAEVIKELSKPIEDIENSLHALLTSEKVITEEKDLILKDVNSNIDSLENAIERFINIEIKLLATFGLICEVDLNKSIQLATELKTLLSLTPQELQNSSLIQMKNEKVSLLKTILSKFDWLDTEIHLRGRNSLETEKLKQIFLTTYQLLTELNKVESVSYFDDIPLTSRVHHDNEKDAMIPLMHHIDQYIELIEIVEEISAVIKIEELKESVNVARELRESIAAVEDGAQSEFSMEMRNEINSKQADLVHQLQRALSAVQVHVFDCVQELSPEIGKDVLERLAKVTSQLQNDLTAVTGVQVAVQAPYIPSDEITKSINISEKLSEMVETIPSEVANVAQTTQPTILEQMNILNKESTIVVQIDAITEDEVKEAVKSKEVFVVEESEVLEKEFQADKAEATNIKQAIAAEVLEQIVIDNVSTIAEEKCLTEKLSSSSVDTVITSDVLVLDKIDTSDNNISVERVSVSQEVLPTTVKQLSDWNMDGTKSDKALEVIEDIHPKASIDQLMLHIEQFISQSTVANELSALIKIEDFEKSLQIAKELQQNIYELTADMQIKDGHMTSHDIQAQQESLSQKLHTSLTAIQQQALENVNKLSPIIDTNVLCNLIEVTGNLDKDIVAIITKIDVQLATNLINDNITQLKEVISEYIPTESTLQIADEQTVVVKEECIDFQKATSTSTESHIAELEITKVVSEEAPLIKDFKDETVTLSMSEQKNTIAEELQEQQTISTAEVKVLSEVVALADNVAVDEVKQSTNEDLLVSKAGEIEIKIVTDEKIVPSEDTEFQQITSTIELQKITGEAAEDREVLSKTIESLIHNIQDYISEDISQIVNNICSIVNLNDLKQSVSLAKDLCQNISQISVSTEMEQKVIPIDVLTKQAITAQQLLKALSTLQIQILENVKELVPFIGNNDITKATNAIERLNIDLEAVVSSYQILLQPSLKTVEELSLKTHLTECEIQTLETISDIVTHSNETEQIHKPNVETQATVPFGMMDNVVFEQINIMNEPEIPRDVAVTHSNEALCVATTTLIVPMNTTAPQSSNETTALEPSDLITNIDTFVSDEVLKVVEELAEHMNIIALKESVAVAKELRERIEEEIDFSLITENKCQEQAQLKQKLLEALTVFQEQTLVNAQEIKDIVNLQDLQRVTDIVIHLQENLRAITQIPQKVESIPDQQMEEIVEVNSMKQLQDLLQEVSNKIDLATPDKSTEDTETLRDTLDEVQTVIIKLKRDFDGTTNDTLNETLEDLECSVRSVQLQINEDSPPQLLKEACATLQLLVTSMKETQEVQLPETTIKEMTEQIILDKCSNETGETVKLLEIAANVDTKHNSSLMDIINNLSSLKDIMKTLRVNFLGNAETLVENGIDVIHNLDQIEDKIFSLERNVEIEKTLSSSDRDIIITAIHSVYGSISNMRGTISSIQKQYMCENFGKPAENILRSIKMVSSILKQGDEESKNKWKRLSKSFRNILNHFEDIKFYINLDKTARLPSDAAFTKIILEELKSNIEGILLTVTEPVVIEKLREALKCAESNLLNIETRTTLEVKEKIPIFKELSSRILNLSLTANTIKLDVNEKSSMIQLHEESEKDTYKYQVTTIITENLATESMSANIEETTPEISINPEDVAKPVSIAIEKNSTQEKAIILEEIINTPMEYVAPSTSHKIEDGRDVGETVVEKKYILHTFEKLSDIKIDELSNEKLTSQVSGSHEAKSQDIIENKESEIIHKSDSISEDNFEKNTISNNNDTTLIQPSTSQETYKEIKDIDVIKNQIMDEESHIEEAHHKKEAETNENTVMVKQEMKPKENKEQTQDKEESLNNEKQLGIKQEEEVLLKLEKIQPDNYQNKNIDPNHKSLEEESQLEKIADMKEAKNKEDADRERKEGEIKYQQDLEENMCLFKETEQANTTEKQKLKQENEAIAQNEKEDTEKIKTEIEKKEAKDDENQKEKDKEVDKLEEHICLENNRLEEKQQIVEVRLKKEEEHIETAAREKQEEEIKRQEELRLEEEVRLVTENKEGVKSDEVERKHEEKSADKKDNKEERVISEKEKKEDDVIKQKADDQLVNEREEADRLEKRKIDLEKTHLKDAQQLKEAHLENKAETIQNADKLQVQELQVKNEVIPAKQKEQDDKLNKDKHEQEKKEEDKLEKKEDKAKQEEVDRLRKDREKAEKLEEETIDLEKNRLEEARQLDDARLKKEAEDKENADREEQEKKRQKELRLEEEARLVKEKEQDDKLEKKERKREIEADDGKQNDEANRLKAEKEVAESKVKQEEEEDWLTKQRHEAEKLEKVNIESKEKRLEETCQLDEARLKKQVEHKEKADKEQEKKRQENLRLEEEAHIVIEKEQDDKLESKKRKDEKEAADRKQKEETDKVKSEKEKKETEEKAEQEKEDQLRKEKREAEKLEKEKIELEKIRLEETRQLDEALLKKEAEDREKAVKEQQEQEKRLQEELRLEEEERLVKEKEQDNKLEKKKQKREKEAADRKQMEEADRVKSEKEKKEAEDKVKQEEEDRLRKESEDAEKLEKEKIESEKKRLEEVRLLDEAHLKKEAEDKEKAAREQQEQEKKRQEELRLEEEARLVKEKEQDDKLEEKKQKREKETADKKQKEETDRLKSENEKKEAEDKSKQEKEDRLRKEKEEAEKLEKEEIELEKKRLEEARQLDEARLKKEAEDKDKADREQQEQEKKRQDELQLEEETRLLKEKEQNDKLEKKKRKREKEAADKKQKEETDRLKSEKEKKDAEDKAKQEEEDRLKQEKEAEKLEKEKLELDKKCLEEARQLDEARLKKEAEDKEKTDREQQEQEKKRQEELRLEEEARLVKEKEQDDKLEEKKRKREKEAADRKQKEEADRLKIENEKKETEDKAKQEEEDRLKKEKEEAEKLEKEKIELEKKRSEEVRQLDEAHFKKEAEDKDKADREQQEQEKKRQDELRLEEETRLLKEKEQNDKLEKKKRKREKEAADKKQKDEADRLKSEKEKKEAEDKAKQEEEDRLKKEKEAAEKLEKEKIELEKKRLEEAHQLDEARLKKEGENKEKADREQQEQQIKRQEEENRLKKKKEAAEKLEKENNKLEKKRLEKARQLDEARLKKEAEDKEKADREQQEQEMKRQEEEDRLKKEKEAAEKLEKEKIELEIKRLEEARQLDEARLKKEAEDKEKADREQQEQEMKRQEEEDRLKKEKEAAEKLEKAKIELEKKRLEEARQLDEARLKKEAEDKEKADREQQEQEKKRQDELQLEEETRLLKEKEQNDKLEKKKRKREKEAADKKQKEETDRLKSEKEKKDAEDKAKQEEEDRLKQEKEAEKLEKEKLELDKKCLEEARQLDEARLKKEAEDKEKADREQQEQEKKRQEELRLEEEARLVKEKEQDDKLKEKKRKREKEAADRKQKEEADRLKIENEKKETEDKAKQEEEDRLKKEKIEAEKLENEKIELEKKRLEVTRQLDEARLKKEAEDKEKADREQQEQEKKRQDELRLEEETRLLKEKEQNDKLEKKKRKREKEAADKKQKEETDRLKSKKEKKEAEDKAKQEEVKRLKKEKEKAEILETEKIESEKKRLEEVRQLKEAGLNKEAEENTDKEQQEKIRQEELCLKEENRLTKEKEKQEDERKHQEQLRHEEEAHRTKEKEQVTDNLQKKKRKQDNKEDKKLKIKEQTDKLDNEKIELEKKVPDRSTRNNDTQFKYDEEAKLQKDDKDTRKVIKNYENERNILNENESNNIHEKLQINDNKKIIKNKETNIEVKGIEKMEQPTEITVGPIKKLDGEELEYNLESSQENQNYIKEYNYEPVTGRRKQDDKEKSSKIIHQNRRDYTMEFARPPGYREKTYEIDRYSLDSHSRSRSPGIFKAETLILDAQIRSSLPPYSEKDRNSETIERREIKHKPKAVSEARSILSEKRSSMPRDIKRKPVFSTHLTDRTAVEGSRVKLMCSVLSLSDPVITWYRNGVIIDNKLKYRTKFVDGLITLEVLNAIPSDSAEYNCTVENENGSVSTSANLKVYPSFKASPIPPTFTRSIRDTYHLAENELVLECRIRGQPLPAITWLKDDKPIVTNDRFQAYYLADGVCRLAIDSPTPDDSGKYTCKAENSVWSDQISHVVNFTGRECQLSPNLATIERSRFNRQAMESRRPHFTNVLSDFKVARGGTIGLQVEIRGSPTRVEWLREGYSVIDTYKNAQSFVEQGLYTLALSDVTEKESGLYTCRAWSNHGTVDMNAAITVVQPNELEGKPAIIVGRPEKDVLISVGEDLNISFRVQGEPKPKVIFMKGIRDITNSQRVCKMTSDDYVKFTLKRSVIADAGTYCILARNAYGCDRAFVTVVIRQRASSENLISDWTYPLDDSAISMAERNYKSVPDRIPGEPSVVDGGNNWVTLAWSKPDPRVTAPVLAYKVESWLAGKEGGARWTELGITPLNSFDAFNLKQGEEYHFRVTPRNRYGWGESVQTSTPIGVGLAGDRPEFVEILPGQLKVLLGSSANLSCSVKGKPIPEVVWMKNGHEIDEEERRMKTTFNGYNCSLTINDIHIEDEARYSCEATNVHGRASTYARLAVVTDKSIWEADAKLKRERSADVEGVYPPQFTMRLRDRRVQATYPVRLTCQVVGSPAPSVTWYRDGEEVTLDSRHTQSQDEHFHTLEIAPTTLEDGGLYEALARNPSGAVSCRCSLVVDKGIRAYVAPEFCCGLEPLYRLSEGEELRISAVVEAYPSVGVTWYRDGIRLRPSRRAVMTLDRDGQIELALAAITPREAGVYTCTASNEVGRASTSGKVEVIGDGPAKKKTPPMLISPDVPYSKEPMFIRKPRSSEAREGDTVIIQCEVVGDPKPDVYWLRDFLKPDYYRDATHFKRVGAGPEYRFEIPHAKLDYTGAYSVVARNVHGEAKAVISLQILAKDPSAADDVHNVRYGRVEVIPRFERDLTDLLCYDGDAIEFECRVSGNPEPDIRWFHYTELIRECPDFEWSCDDGTARLKIKQVTAEDEGTYICEAANNLGKATSSACLVVYPPGEPNTLSQRLRRPPALLSAASTPRSTPRSTPARSVSRTPGPDPRRLCSSPSRQMAPKFYTYPFNKVVEEGDHVVFQCAVKGLPAPWATWDKDGVIITPSSRITIREKDEILRILEIEQVTIEDVGLYRITLENDFGRAEASARLEVITQKGKFYAGVRSCSASPRKSFSYRRRAPSSSKD
ncbi:uncharacterized protein ACR2FA_003089 isoform 2-T2 [Aphomia sociella]